MTSLLPFRGIVLAATLLVLHTGCIGPADAGLESDAPAQAVSVPAPKAMRARHLVAVVADNPGTEVTDFVVPFGVIAASGAADVVGVATAPGPVTLLPALTLHLEQTLADFDARYPDGADVVVVPALHDAANPAVVDWVQRQWRSGAVVVGVCDGVLTLVNAGLLHGRHATGHWYSLRGLRRDHPETHWQSHRRYVADGRVITTTGVTASIPVALALVEAMGGEALAARTAAALGVADHGTAHDSTAFGLSAALVATALFNGARFWSHETVGLPVRDGIDEIALALAADAWSRTFRSTAVALHPEQPTVRSKRGLVFEVEDAAGSVDVTVDVSPAATRPASALDRALAELSSRYGRSTGALVAAQLEYDVTAAR